MLRRSILNQMKRCRWIYCFLSLSLVSCAGIRSRYYTVVEGDTLARVAKNYGVGRDELERVNQDVVADGLRVGQKLYIPFEKHPEWDYDLYFEPPDRTPSDAEVLQDLGRVSFHWPVKGRISSRFGRRFMRGRGNHMHEGIDIAARKGTPVKAARSGHIVYASNRIPGYGNMVIVQHPDKYSSVYAHLSRMKVKKGDFVSRGELVGTVGRTGRTTGHHLHFEVRNSRRPIDPMPFLTEQFARHP